MTFATYGNTGPFTNNVTPPGINATFLNNVESFLDQIISSAVADANVTANGSGALTVVSATMTAAGTGLTVQHNALVSGVLTTTGNHVANGGMNTNTIRDNVGGNVGMDLSVGTGEVKFPVNMKGVLKSIGGLHTLTDWNAGFVGITTGGTTITHGLKNASGVATAATAIVATCASSGLAGVITINSQNTTQFVAATSVNCNIFWLAILL